MTQLFGASAVTKDYVLGVSDYSKATWTQNFIASIAGAVASITVAAPLDTVKTRIQNANFEQKVPGIRVVKDLIRNEGASAFFKGLTPKVSIRPSLFFIEKTHTSNTAPCGWSEAGLQLYPCAVVDTPVRQVCIDSVNYRMAHDTWVFSLPFIGARLKVHVIEVTYISLWSNAPLSNLIFRRVRLNRATDSAHSPTTTCAAAHSDENGLLPVSPSSNPVRQLSSERE